MARIAATVSAAMAIMAVPLVLTSRAQAQQPVAQASQTVASTGIDVGRAGTFGPSGAPGGGTRGEDRHCGDGVVQCGTVTVTVAANATVHSVKYEVRDGHDDWQPGPLGWSSWESKGDRTLPDGRREFSATLKNWSEDRAREIRITVF